MEFRTVVPNDTNMAFSGRKLEEEADLNFIKAVYKINIKYYGLDTKCKLRK